MARLRGFVWLAAGLVVAALAGIVAYVALSTAAPSESDQPGRLAPSVSVVVANRGIDVRSLLTAEDLETKKMPIDAVPETAIRDVEEAVGRITMAPLYPGEIVLEQRLVDPDVLAADGRTAILINDDQVLMAFPAGDLMSSLNILKPGDHIDLLLTKSLPEDALITGALPDEITAGGEGTEQTTFSLLQNVVIAQIMGQGDEGGARAFLFTVDPQDALLLKYVKDTGGTIDVVLRAPGVEGEFELFPVDLEYFINRNRVSEEGEP